MTMRWWRSARSEAVGRSRRASHGCGPTMPRSRSAVDAHPAKSWTPVFRLQAKLSALFGARRCRGLARQAIGNQVGAEGATLGANQILLALVHVGHGGAGLHLVHEHRALLFAGGLVIGAQPRPLAALFVGE